PWLRPAQCCGGRSGCGRLEFWAHDTVAQKDYEPVLPPMPEELPDDEEATRIICLVKNKQPLGATIKRNEISGEIFIARVIHGGLADRSGLLHAGDRIIEVNGFPVYGMEPEQVIQVQARSQGTIMFKVVPITERPVHNQTMLYVRTMVDYSPQEDPAIPCADAGMSFTKGDVLEIVDQTDALWWQAKKLPSNTACAGLIPSTDLLKRKQRESWWSQPYQPHACMKTCKFIHIFLRPYISLFKNGYYLQGKCYRNVAGCACVLAWKCNLTRFQSFYIRNMGFFQPNCPKITIMHVRCMEPIQHIHSCIQVLRR
uniref:Membrane protein, palmitoylated 4-like n=1 Tax=Sander lucioperca TaxID=283035 RepID=A0A8C9ZAL7_SANLU